MDTPFEELIERGIHGGGCSGKVVRLVVQWVDFEYSAELEEWVEDYVGLAVEVV